MKTRRALCALGATFALGCYGPPILAATVERLPLPRAVAQADQIVHGDVVATQCLLSDDGLRIYTDAQVRVRETLKGPAAQLVTVRTLGGEVGTVGQVVPGAPRLHAGEEVVLLLQQVRGQPGASPPRIVGLAQGLYRVVRPRATGVPTAVQSLAGIELVDLGPAEAAGSEPPAQPLVELLGRLRTIAEGAQR